ncbi:MULTISPECIES: dihydroneopterin aldolase [Chitinophagaceae]
MLKIELKNILFRANHGLYPGEKEIGGTFEVNAWVAYTSDSKIIRKLEDTIDYSKVFSLIKQEMGEPEDLMETVITKIAHKIFDTFPSSHEVYICISKVNPPLPIYSGSAGVSIQLQRDEI